MIQSSSASVGILQALAMGGLIGLDSSVYVLFGQNIGTCITAVLAAVGTNRNAKRTTIIHLMFNIIGTIVFTIICQLTPFTDWIAGFTPDKPAAQIANVHTIFNVTTTLLLLPFANGLAYLATRILPDLPQETPDSDVDRWFDSFFKGNKLGSSAMAIESLSRDVQSMLRLASKNVSAAFAAVQNGCKDGIEDIEQAEEEIDLYNSHISQKASRILALELGAEDVNSVQQIYRITGNVERIGDHAMNIAECAKEIEEKGIVFSHEADRELSTLFSAVQEITHDAITAFTTGDLALAYRVEPLEEVIDALCDEMKLHHVDRLQQGICTLHQGFVFNDLLTNFERVSDHCSNLAVATIELESDSFDPHQYMISLKAARSHGFDQYYEEYRRKFSLPEG